MTLNIHSYAYGNAANNTDCHEGPIALKNIENQCDIKAALDWQKILTSEDPRTQAEALNAVIDINTRLAHQVAASIADQKQFITLGGDHSCAIGTWSGAALATREHGQLGLIWFDAHMDSNTFDSSPTGNIHGMPLSALLGFGDEQLANLLGFSPKLHPENVVQIGIRSYQSGEAELLEKLGVRIYYMDEINNRGLDAVMQEALTQVTANTSHFGMTMDLDGFDPEDAPGVGCREKNGVRADELLPLLSDVGQHEKFIGAEIVEYNPSRDIDHKTAKLVYKIIATIQHKC